jgi:hypothetical protein
LQKASEILMENSLMKPKLHWFQRDVDYHDSQGFIKRFQEAKDCPRWLLKSAENALTYPLGFREIVMDHLLYWLLNPDKRPAEGKEDVPVPKTSDGILMQKTTKNSIDPDMCGPKIKLVYGGDRILVTGDVQGDLWSVCKDIGGGFWDKTRKIWVFPKAKHDDLMRVFKPGGIS